MALYFVFGVMLVLIVACIWGDACSHSGLYLG